MQQAVTVDPSHARLSREQRHTFASEGYLIFRGVVDPRDLWRFHRELLGEFELVRREGELFSGGGTVSGHLNCFPGRSSRFIQDALEEAGILEVVRELSPIPLRAPNVGLNFNLPGSHDQNEHIDGFYAAPFMVANVAVVDTTEANGSMEVLRRTHLRDNRYWEILSMRLDRVRVNLRAGDVLVRTSCLWHRGMANHSRLPRPMFALTWENGGSTLADPYSAHDGEIRFLPNRHTTDWRGQLRERAFVAAPRIGRAFLFLRSMMESPPVGG